MPSADILRLSAALSLALGSCVPFEPFPHHISGTYAHSLHFGDILEIRDLVRDCKDVRHPICAIEVVAPDRAVVDSGTACEPPGGTVSQFTVRKKNGHWSIDGSSIEDRSMIVWNEPVGSN